MLLLVTLTTMLLDTHTNATANLPPTPLHGASSVALRARHLGLATWLRAPHPTVERPQSTPATTPTPVTHSLQT